MKLMEGFDSNYRYILVAARRARQLSGGAPPLVSTNTRKPYRVAQEEIAAGKMQYSINGKGRAAEQPAETPAGRQELSPKQNQNSH